MTTSTTGALVKTEAREIQTPNALEILAELARSCPDPTVAVAVAKSVADLQQSMERFKWEREERQSKIDFDEALNQCQSQIGRIAPNAKRENNIMWADYAQIDRVIRPIYIKSGFSIAFSEVENRTERLRMCATLSRGGVSREYFADISRNAANSKMNQLDADASAASRVKRYLLLDIFNIAVGIDKDEKEPYTAPEDLLDESIVTDFVDSIEGSATPDELKRNYQAAQKAGAKDASALKAFDDAKKRTWYGKGFGK